MGDHVRNPIHDVAPVNSAFVATRAATGAGPGNLFGAAARGMGMTNPANAVNGLSTTGNALNALGPIASLAAGGYNLYNGISGLTDDDSSNDVRSGFQTAGGAAALVGGAGGLAAMTAAGAAGTGAMGALAAAGPVGAGIAATIGLGLRGEGFMQDHFGMGVGDIIEGGGDAGRDFANWLGAEEGGWGEAVGGAIGTGVGAIGGGLAAVGSGVLGVGEDIGSAISWAASGISSWFD